jgi:hypothetical protein
LERNNSDYGCKKHTLPLLLPSQRGALRRRRHADMAGYAADAYTAAGGAEEEDVRLVDAGAAGPVAAAALRAGAVADPRGADEHGAALPPLPPLPVAAAVDAGEDDERHDGQAEDDRAVERLPAEPALRHAQELRAHLFFLDGVVMEWWKRTLAGAAVFIAVGGLARLLQPCIIIPKQHARASGFLLLRRRGVCLFGCLITGGASSISYNQ